MNGIDRLTFTLNARVLDGRINLKGRFFRFCITLVSVQTVHIVLRHYYTYWLYVKLYHVQQIEAKGYVCWNDVIG